MAGWNDETLTYSQRHASETHGRWRLTCLSPRYQAMASHNALVYDLAEKYKAEGMEHGRAWLKADAELNPGEVIEDFIEDQCGGCAFYIALEGALGSDWGACTNPASEHDGTLLFEHDGCAAHERSPLVTVEDLQEYRRELERRLSDDTYGFAAEELARVEKLLADTAAQSAATPPATSRT